MPGVFNTMNHETEPYSREVAGLLMKSIAEIFFMLGDVEKGDIDNAENRRQTVLSMLEENGRMLEELASIAGGYPLKWPLPEDPTSPELAKLYEQMEELGYPMPLKNDDMGKIGEIEVRSLSHVVRQAQFNRTGEDWFPIRNIITSVERVLDIGILAARISALHGH